MDTRAMEKPSPIAKVVSHSKRMNHEIFNNSVDFIMLSSRNELNSEEESFRIVPINLGENEENGKVVCRIEKEHDEDENIKPFIFRSFVDDFFRVNDKTVRKGQRRILQDNDKISLVKKPNVFFNFYDLRDFYETQFPENMMKDYFVERLLGTGQTGCAYLVQNIRTFNRFALKKVKKSPEESPNDFAFEAKIMLNLNHPNIVKLLHVYDDVDSTFLFTEYLNFQDLLNAVNSNVNIRLSETVARDCFSQITQGLKYLHELNICHRDIKCDNIFVNKENGRYICKIGDFGLSAYDTNLTHTCGTVLYSPPEMFVKNQIYKGKKSDIWSLGVVLFCMISGKFPFHKSFTNCGTIEDQIKAGIVRFRCDNIWKTVSYECKHLICGMINVDPILRYDIYEIEYHPWVKNIGTLQNPRKRPIDVTLLKNVKLIQNVLVKKPKIIMT